jgi:ribosomal protein L35AE/L33A
MEIDQERIHCGGCNKNLVDFRGKSVEETIEILKKSQNQVCGVYHKKDIVVKSYVFPKFSFTKRFVAAALLALGLFPTWAEAQLVEKDSTAQYQITQSSNTKNDIVVITGSVKDSTAEVLYGANVVLFKGEDIIKGTATDINGSFRLELPKKELGKEIRVEVSFISFETKKIELKLKATNNISVELVEGFLGEPVIVGLKDWTDQKNFDKMWSGRIFTREELNRE